VWDLAKLELPVVSIFTGSKKLEAIDWCPW
jgi:hypothetical protein